VADVSKDTFVRLSVELPTGVKVKSRTTVPKEIKGSTFPFGLNLLDGVTTRVSESHSMESNGPIVLELEFPETLRAAVLEALDKLRTVGRV
jgi:hypothetical protein